MNELNWGYTYQGIEEWDEPIPTAGAPVTVHDVMDSMAAAGTDMEAFAHSKLGEFAIRSSYLNNHVGDITAPEVAAYWAEHGMVHEAHDVDDADRQWTSLVPADYDPAKSYPVLFVWHGTGNPVLLAEGYGFGKAAAARGWIAVFPWAANDDLYLGEFDRILGYLREHYNIDAERIYTVGYSKGGLISQLLALQRADVLAASASCGMPAGGAPTEQLRSDDFTRAGKGIPMLFFGGKLDGVTGPVSYDVSYKLRGAAGFLALNAIGQGAEVLRGARNPYDNTEADIERALGLPFDVVEELEDDGTFYRLGTYVDADGRSRVRFIVCRDAIHWPTPSMADMVLSFFEGFTSRDAVVPSEMDLKAFLRSFSK